MLDENNADRAYNKFDNHFQHLCNEAMHVKYKNNKLYHNRQKLWITHGIIHSVYRKSSMTMFKNQNFGVQAKIY